MRRIDSTRAFELWRRALGGLVLLVMGVTLAPAETHAGDRQYLDPVPDVGALGGPMAGTDMTEWLDGRRLFERDFEVREGIGPYFNGNTCQGCHQLGADGGAGPLDTNATRFGRLNPDGSFDYLPGGPILSREVAFPHQREEAPPEANVLVQRQAPPLFGDGLIDSIPDDVILANADPNDYDHDGIRGRANLIHGKVGRFGWKGQIPTVRGFVLDALGNEAGLTAPADGSGFAVTQDDDDVPDPEVGNDVVDALTYYISRLAPPPRAPVSQDTNAATVTRGETQFKAIGCSSCHTPELQGADGPVELYSDLLLHDVSNPDADDPGVPDGSAGMHDYRTPELWGLRFSAPYMHDGRAETIDAAIRDHYGEADQVRKAYLDLTDLQRQDLLNFLETL